MTGLLLTLLLSVDPMPEKTPIEIHPGVPAPKETTPVIWAGTDGDSGVFVPGQVYIQDAEKLRVCRAEKGKCETDLAYEKAFNWVPWYVWILTGAAMGGTLAWYLK